MKTNRSTLHTQKQSLGEEGLSIRSTTRFKEERRQKVRSIILNERYSISEIAKKMDVSEQTIYKDVEELKNKKQIPEDYSLKYSMSKKEFENHICFLVTSNRTFTISEFAKELKTSESQAYVYVNKLKEEGRIPKTFLFRHASVNDELRGRIFSLALTKDYSITEIANHVGVSHTTAREHIKKLIQEERLPEDFTLPRFSPMGDFADEIYTLAYIEKKSAADIAEQLSISTTTVYLGVKNLKADKRIPETFSFRKSYKTKKQTIKDKVYTSIKKEKKNAEEIAIELKEDTKVIYRLIKELQLEGKLTGKHTKVSSSSEEQLKDQIPSLALVEKKSVHEISNKLGINQATTYKLIKELKDEGKLPVDFSFTLFMSKSEFKDKVRSFILDKHYDIDKISTILSVKKPTVRKYIEALKKEGLIPEDFSLTFFRSEEELGEKIYNLSVIKKLSVDNVAKALQISRATIYRFVQKFKNEGKIESDFKFEMSDSEKEVQAIKGRAKEEVLFLLNQRVKVNDIAKQLGVQSNSVRNYIKELKQEKRLPQDFSATFLMSQSTFEKAVYSGVLQDRTFIEIAKELNVSASTVGKYCRQLQEEGKIPQDFFIQQKKRQEDKICKLALHERLSAQRIADKMGLNVGTIYKQIKTLKLNGSLPHDFEFTKRKTN